MRYHFQGRSRDTFGNVKQNLPITIYETGTTTPATIYKDATGGVPVSAGPQVISDNFGYFDFYVDNLDYGETVTAYTIEEKLAMELEMSFRAANLYNFKELTYSNSLLSEINIYTDSNKNTKLFRKALNYDGEDKLSQITLTRISPSSSLIKTLNYDGEDRLVTITISGSEY